MVIVYYIFWQAKFHLGWTSESEEEDEPSEFDESQRKLCHPLCQCQKCRPLQRVG